MAVPSETSRGSAIAGFMRRRAKLLVYAVGLVPAAWTLHLGMSDQLGADPVKTLERTLGLWALRFLVLGLAITPLRRLGGPNLIGYRRAIGLLAFYYAAFHLTTYVWLDQDLDFAAVWGDIVKRPYITVGLLSFIILVPLAATSHNAMVKWLGGGRWRTLHRFVYLAAAAAALHFVLQAKAWSPEPLIYAGLIAGLLGWRVWDAFVAAPRRSSSRR